MNTKTSQKSRPLWHQGNVHPPFLVQAQRPPYYKTRRIT